jgi:hypothetical protein
MLGAGITLLAGADAALILFRLHQSKKMGTISDRIVTGSADEDAGNFSPIRLGSVLVLLALYFVGINALGYYVATPLFVFFLLLALGVRSWKGLLVPTLSLVIIWSVLFHYVLGVPLPHGTFSHWFG